MASLKQDAASNSLRGRFSNHNHRIKCLFAVPYDTVVRDLFCRCKVLTTKLPNQSSIITIMTKAAIKASRGLLRDFSELEHLQVSVKSNKSFVTSADVKANKILIEELLRARPEYSLVSEEQEEIVGSNRDFTWIVDSLDGTVNYMHGFPHWATSIALKKHKEVVAAVTYDPVKNEMFWAEKGCGAYVNDKKIRVSGRKPSSDLLVAVGSFDANVSQKNVPAMLNSLRRTGSCTLDMAYLAAGRIDILLNLHDHQTEWDSAAGMLLIREAGGILAAKDGSSTNNFADIAVMCNINLVEIATDMCRRIY